MKHWKTILFKEKPDSPIDQLVRRFVEATGVSVSNKFGSLNTESIIMTVGSGDRLQINKNSSSNFDGDLRNDAKAVWIGWENFPIKRSLLASIREIAELQSKQREMEDITVLFNEINDYLRL